MTVMEVCHYAQFDIDFFFHRFLPFLVFMEIVQSEIMILKLFFNCIVMNYINGF